MDILAIAAAFETAISASFIDSNNITNEKLDHEKVSRLRSLLLADFGLLANNSELVANRNTPATSSSC